MSNQYRILPAWEVTIRHRNRPPTIQTCAWCDLCGLWHKHGILPKGTREIQLVPHCTRNPITESQYIVRLVGKVTPHMKKDVWRRKPLGPDVPY
jgi:hypothetical protein